MERRRCPGSPDDSGRKLLCETQLCKTQLCGMRAETGNGMWECNYGKEPLDIRLLVLRFLRKSPLILAAALLGALCVGGPYFLVKVTF